MEMGKQKGKKYISTETCWVKIWEFFGQFWEICSSFVLIIFQTLRNLRDNDLSVEHTEVSARQRAGTLEWVVKYSQEAFT